MQSPSVGESRVLHRARKLRSAQIALDYAIRRGAEPTVIEDLTAEVELRHTYLLDAVDALPPYDAAEAITMSAV